MDLHSDLVIWVSHSPGESAATGRRYSRKKPAVMGARLRNEVVSKITYSFKESLLVVVLPRDRPPS